MSERVVERSSIQQVKVFTLNPQKREVIRGMESFVESQLDLLADVQTCWQPQDLLPDLNAENWLDSVNQLRLQAEGLSDEVLVVLVGDMITEEALPTYQSLLNGFDEISDRSGTDASPWAQWTRGWTSEENRHGDLLNKYLYLSGRVDMRAVETTIHRLIRNGFNPNTANDPYKGFIYTSFQERATKISHKNVAGLGRKAGDQHLHDICSTIAADEARHEKAYTRFMGQIFEQDPPEAVTAFEGVLRGQIVMPAQLMDDGANPDLFDSFSIVAQRLGVYTAINYAQIIEHLVKVWDVGNLKGLSGDAARAQDYLCKLAPRYLKLAERHTDRKNSIPPRRFSWIFNRSV